MDQVRAWKDPYYRRQLDAAAQSAPESPAGVVSLSDDELGEVGGGTTWGAVVTGGVIAASLARCSPDGTMCGSCKWGSAGCC
ncbi:mersacidin/lichenicidin family type 2 lantibiotic [Actinomycetota bacterium Odt1-20B]